MAGKLARLVGGPHDGLELHVLQGCAALFLSARKLEANGFFGFKLVDVDERHEYRWEGARCEDGALRFDYREKEA